MKTIQQLLDEKDTGIWSVSPSDSVYDAVALMSEKDVGALLVLEDNKLCGLLSERDYARKIILKERSSKGTNVSDIMTEKVYTTFPDDTVENCMSVMTQKRFRHLPVVDKESGNIVGMVSIGDLVKAIIEEQKFTIEQLEQYINITY